VFYNGYKPDRDTALKQGHAFYSHVKNGIFTRGILLDIPRLKGVPYLEPGEPIYVEDLEAWEKKAGVKVSSGDALFVRTGVWARRNAVGPWLSRPGRRGQVSRTRSFGHPPGSSNAHKRVSQLRGPTFRASPRLAPSLCSVNRIAVTATTPPEIAVRPACGSRLTPSFGDPAVVVNPGAEGGEVALDKGKPVR